MDITNHKLNALVNKKLIKSYSQEVCDRSDILLQWEILKDQDCDEAVIYNVLKVSRSTMYRWKRYEKQEGISGLESASRRPDTVRQPVK